MKYIVLLLFTLFLSCKREDDFATYSSHVPFSNDQYLRCSVTFLDDDNYMLYFTSESNTLYGFDVLSYGKIGKKSGLSYGIDKLTGEHLFYSISGNQLHFHGNHFSRLQFNKAKKLSTEEKDYWTQQYNFLKEYKPQEEFRNNDVVVKITHQLFPLIYKNEHVMLIFNSQFYYIMYENLILSNGVWHQKGNRIVLEELYTGDLFEDDFEGLSDSFQKEISKNNRVFELMLDQDTTITTIKFPVMIYDNKFSERILDLKSVILNDTIDMSGFIGM